MRCPLSIRDETALRRNAPRRRQIREQRRERGGDERDRRVEGEAVVAWRAGVAAVAWQEQRAPARCPLKGLVLARVPGVAVEGGQRHGGAVHRQGRVSVLPVTYHHVDMGPGPDPNGPRGPYVLR